MIEREVQLFADALSQARSPQAVIDLACEKAIQIFNLDRVVLRYYLDDSMLHGARESSPKFRAYHSPLMLGAAGIMCGSKAMELPVFVSDVERSNKNVELAQYLRRAGTNSICITPIYDGERIRGWIEFHHCSRFRRWSEADRFLFLHLSGLIGFALKQAFILGFTDTTTSPDNVQGEERLAVYAKRIEALYQVSRALQFNLDPSLVCLKGLRAVVEATGSDCGIALLYDRNSGVFELVAAQGVSQEYVQAVEDTINGPSLVRLAVESKQGLLIEDVQHDPRAVVKLATKEGLHSTAVMPLLSEDSALGAIALFRKKLNPYTTDDFELVAAACNQIALAVHQAELFSNQRKQARSIAALYRLSHELTRHFSPKEIAEHAFSILHEELACKRVWLGVISEQGTHLVGKAGFGPGMRKRISELQIELQIRHDLLDEAIRLKQPVVVKPEDNPECGTLHRIVRRLNPGPFVIVPMVSLGQVVGVLVIEPSVPSGFFAENKLSLLSSMAAEIGYVFVARRYEKRVAEADKMRMAGLFASGIAHNFNNLLQAVIGQCSLLDLQLDKDSGLKKSVKVIQEAAHKGGGLINQLLNYTQQQENERKKLSLKALLSDCCDLYQSVLGQKVALQMEVDIDTPQIFGDFSQLQQVIINLLINAREAIRNDRGEVRIHVCGVRLRSAEIDPELAPGRYVRISVMDNGIGMDEERLSRCFEPFFTTKNVDSMTGIGVAGSGLGLATAYSVLKAHAGLITAQSEVGKGTVFTLYLPALQSVEMEESTQTQSAATAGAFLLGVEGNTERKILSVLNKVGIRPAIFRSELRLSNALKNKDRRVVLCVDADTSGADLVDLTSSLLNGGQIIKALVFTFDTAVWEGRLRGIKDVIVLKKPVDENTTIELFYGIKLLPDNRADLGSKVEVVREKPKASSQSATEKSACVESVGEHEKSPIT